MSSPESRNKHRRSHRKSRLGCQQCKRRKIKCDEARPSCLNCVRRDEDCSFALEPEDRGSRSEGCSCKCLGCHPSSSNANQRHDLSSTNSPDTQMDQVGCNSKTLEMRETLLEQSAKLDAMSRRLTSMENLILQSSRPETSQPALSYTDMELLHHFFSMTVPTVAMDDQAYEFWSIRLPEIGFAHPHVLHLMLAFAALHKARLYPYQRDSLVIQSQRHYNLGVRGSTEMLKDINDDNYEFVHASATLIGLINLAIGPRPGEYIAFSECNDISFLSLLRGVRAIRSHKEHLSTADSVSSGSFNPMTPQTPSAEAQLLYDCKVHLRHIRRLIREIPDLKLQSSYLVALEDLEQFFLRAHGASPEAPNALVQIDTAHRATPLGWLYRISDDFLSQIQIKHPLALAMLYLFCVVLKELELGWPAEGWAEHIMSGIWESIRMEDRHLIRWPMNRMKWEPVERQ
ncbi:C6 finger domain protein [Colletotrichum truncatum]|uniref:C6 finger domain protein n=1 Tax=Colletotrichum truncatum TaxID=5467 RepID=A0ACC3Z6X3_COLTU|nr:C6 finger domain protein [Colletotrichum truncatum]KAF6788004.1 C6 finger domain protein [Colletotrichum truncatum]